MKYRSFFVLVPLLAISLLSTEIAYAKQRICGNSVAVINSTGEEKTDLHIEIKSDTKIYLKEVKCDVNNVAVLKPEIKIVTGNGTHKINIDAAPVNIPEGAIVRCDWEVLQNEKNYCYGEIRLTPILFEEETDIPVPGWRVTGEGDVYLVNAYPSIIQFSNLEMLRSGTFDSDLMEQWINGLIPANVPGILSSGEIPAAINEVPSELYVGTAALEVGEFLLARANTQFEGSDSLISTALTAAVHEQQLVDLLNFEVTQSTYFTWETASETENLGFNIWCAQMDNSNIKNVIKVNQDVISTKAEPPNGATYSFKKALPSGTYYCAIEDINENQECTLHCDNIARTVIGDQSDLDNAIALCNAIKSEVNGKCLNN